MIGTLSMEDLARIRRMSQTDAEAYIKHFELTDTERSQALALAGRSIVQPEAPPTLPRGQIHDASRPLWFVSAWLLGASWRQLAFLHKITPQTVMASADKIMTSPQRQAARLATAISPERLSAFRAEFLRNDWAGFEPPAVAEKLLSITQED